MTIFHLYHNTQIGVLGRGFPQVISSVLCVIDFSFSVICVLLILLNSVKLLQSVVEVDLVLCFSILHNLLIYSGNFYMVSEPSLLEKR